MTTLERDELRELYPFTAGLCRIWCRRLQGDDRHWFDMTHPARGHDDCLKLVAHYLREWPAFYEFRITADFDCLRPLA